MMRAVVRRLAASDDSVGVRTGGSLMSGKTKNRNGTGRPITADGFIVRIGGGLQAVARLALISLLVSSCAYAAVSGSLPSACNADHCGLLADGAYTNVVIGRLDSVGTSADLREAFQWAKTHGYWKSLPASIEPYLRDVQLVTIAVSKEMASRPVTLFMLRTEYGSAPYHVGDLVRYAPHDAAHDETAKGSPDDLALFHGLTGCVATLCQNGDGACLARYRQGAFTTVSGQQVSLTTGHLVRGGVRIDPISLLPVH